MHLEIIGDTAWYPKETGNKRVTTSGTVLEYSPKIFPDLLRTVCQKQFSEAILEHKLNEEQKKRLLIGRLSVSVHPNIICMVSGVASSIPARSHTFVEIDHEIISTVILLPSADSFKKGCCQLQAKVCAWITGYPLVQVCPGKSVVRWTDRPAMTIVVDLGCKAPKQTNKIICMALFPSWSVWVCGCQSSAKGVPLPLQMFNQSTHYWQICSSAIYGNVLHVIAVLQQFFAYTCKLKMNCLITYNCKPKTNMHASKPNSNKNTVLFGPHCLLISYT